MLALLVMVPALVTLTTGAASQVVQALPPGFINQTVASISRPTAVEALPNGRVVVLEQHTGRVRLIDTNTGTPLPDPALDLAVCTGNEQGLLGFTEDPDFARNGRVYVYYTTSIGGNCRNRVSAFTMSGDTISPASEQVLVDVNTVRSNHNGGDLEVGNDGYLYITVGDGGADPRGNSGSGGSNNAAQDLSILHGKVLRVDRFTGFAPPSNPFYNSPGAFNCGKTINFPALGSHCREIFLYGARNAWRFAFDPNVSGTRFFFNDVGQSGGSRREEVNHAAVGGNFGWNTCEGTCGFPGLIDPITQYGGTTGGYITAAAFVPDGAWPAEYDAAYLFGDGSSGRIWVLKNDGTVDYDAPFLTGAFSLADMAFVLESSGWALYYTTTGPVNGATVHKVTYATSPSAPSGPLVFDRLPTVQRAFDSRTESPPARIRGGRTRLISLGAAAVGAEAALVNITLTNPVGDTFATAWEPRTTRPATSNINALGGEDVANASVVPVDAQGRIVIHTYTTSHMIVDVAGVFRSAPVATTAGRFESAAVERVVDSRQPPSASNNYTRGGSGDGEIVNVPISGVAGVPGSGVDSVVVILSGISPPGPGPGWLAAFAGGTTLPPASNLNINGGADVRVNTAVVPLGADGSIDVYLFNVADVIVEVVGWFTDGSAAVSTEGRFRQVNPTREVDTRANLGFGPLSHGETETINPASVPNTASAAVQNLTFAPSGGWGYVTSFGDPPAPELSNLNATAPGQTRAALAFTPLAASGAVSYFGASPTHGGDHQFLVDVLGYFE